MATLANYAKAVRDQTDEALALADRLSSIENMPRQYIAELLCIRLFALLEITIEDCACRLVSGAVYCDGASPQLSRPSPTHGAERAREAMRIYGRTKPRNKLRWNKSSEIAENLEMLFPRNEHFVATLLGQGAFISDLRKIRNHIAHRNAGTREKFQQVVSAYYGAAIPSMTPGKLLLSPRFRPMKLETMCRQTRTVLLAAIRG